ncbi:DUF4259 domain-containing protein [Paraflavitalea soli]|uniref:DUF4259 domain-containing protein n=1 Tax=Paraflavitalea soli TaxID=2315862 RepID=A0A3B7MT14_9BACT|nr:DUF4259 domain-containing protein [Paraflavitalea soli]AXY77007.1 DUF4259 domain-containing protein [Paraflavitalea soli]
MGTWGHRNFENDAALDFVNEVEDNGIDVIEDTIQRVANLPEEDYLEDDDSASVLAAIEFIAAAKGKQSEDFPESAEEWLGKTNPASLLSLDKAQLAKIIERVRNNSGLRDAWQEEGDEPTEWLAVLSDLENRVS